MKILIFILLFASTLQGQYRPPNSNTMGGKGYITTTSLGGEGLDNPGDNLPSYDPDAQALFDRGTSITTDEKTAINTTISYWNTTSPGLLDSMDVIVLPRFFSNSTDAVLNWVGDYSNATIVASNPFTEHVGFQSNGTSQYLNSNHNLSTFGGDFTLNGNCFGVLTCSDVSNSDMQDFAVYDGTHAHTLNTREALSPNRFASMNNGGSINRITNTNSIGYFTDVRTSNTAGTKYKNTASVGSYTTTATGIPNRVFFVSAYNFNGSPLANAYSTRIMGGYWCGGKLSATQITTFVTGIEMGLDVLGAGIIP